MTGTRILVVEDDRPLQKVITTALTDAGYAASAVSDGIQASQHLRESDIDVVLLDIGLPFVDGWTILGQLEGRPLPAVIVISARGDEHDKVRALDLGADDYLTKPFGADELLARVRAVLRRTQPTTNTHTVECGDVVVSLGARAVTKAGAEIRLTPTEWTLLATLAENHGVAMEHSDLLRKVWGPEYVGDRNYLRTFIQRLRLKLEIDPSHPDVIVTVGRRGYRFGAVAEN